MMTRTMTLTMAGLVAVALAIGLTTAVLLTPPLRAHPASPSTLLLVYSLGLAVPFVGVGLTLSRTPPVLRWMNRHHTAITVAAGTVMVLIGILLFTGTLTRLNQYFGFASSGLGTKL